MRRKRQGDGLRNTFSPARCPAGPCKRRQVMLKRMAITSLAAAAFFSTATVVTAPFAPADAQVSITFGSPPPPPRYEVLPAPRAGYVWAPGHYERYRDQYVWRPGQWMVERPGYRYVAPSWA